jgi:hypothetical protein
MINNAFVVSSFPKSEHDDCDGCENFERENADCYACFNYSKWKSQGAKNTEQQVQPDNAEKEIPFGYYPNNEFND